MNEYEIFSQYIGNDSRLDSLFVKLSTDTDIGVRSILPISLNIVEKLDLGTPSVTFDFIDGEGDLSNKNVPQSGTIFYLDIGRSILETKRTKLRLTKMLSVSPNGGSERLVYRMFLAHFGWDKYIGETHNRAWVTGNPSKVVEEIVKECGWESTIISPCEEEDIVIQPNWTNSDLIKWIADSYTVGDGRPRYCGRFDGTFVFKSIQEMVKDQANIAARGEIPILRMEGQNSKNTRREETARNGGVPTYFTDYRIYETQAENRLLGGGGVKSYTYDSHTDKFMIDDWGVEDLDCPQMSDWTATSTNLTKSRTILMNGRGPDNKRNATRMVTSAIDDIVGMTISTEGSLAMRSGMMVEILIPTNQNTQELYNIMYSGFWMISGVHHSINFGKSMMTTVTNLIRSGHDSKEIQDSARTKTGKFIGSTL